MPAVDPVILQLRADDAEYRRRLQTDVRLTDQAFSAMDGRVRAFASSFAGILSSVSAGALATTFLQLAEVSKQLDAQLRLATASFGTFAQAQEDTRRIAADTRSGIEETVSLYGNFARASAETGRSQAEAARATETFSKALKIGGADANAAASATLQFGQALASGALRGDEFNSIAEASPRILRLIAEAMGTTAGKTRALAAEGKLTSDVLFRALTDRRFTAGIDAEFDQLPVTIGQAMTQIRNSAVAVFGEFDRGGQFSNAIASFLAEGTDTFESLASKAHDAGLDIRAAFTGLRDVFAPMLAGATEVFNLIDRKANYARDSIANILSLFDKIRNVDIGAERAIRGAGNALVRGGVLNPVYRSQLPEYSNTAGTFLRSDRRTRAQDRREQAVRRLEDQGFVVPRNADGSVDEAGIRRRAPTPRIRSTASGGGGAGGSKPKARGRSTGSATDDALTAAEIIKAVAKDLDAVTRAGSGLVLSESERLEKAARLFRGVLGEEGKDYADPFAGVADYDRQRRVDADLQQDAERDLQDQRVANIRNLSDLYTDLFIGGTDDVWRNFKAQGLRALALILAQATATSFGAGGGGIKSLLGNLGKAAGSVFGGGGIFGRASGGYLGPGQIARVNEGRGGVELLRMGAQGGTVIPLGRADAVARPAGPTIVQQYFTLDNRGGITTERLLRDVDSRIKTEAIRAGGASLVASQRATPGTIAKYGQLEG